MVVVPIFSCMPKTSPTNMKWWRKKLTQYVNTMSLESAKATHVRVRSERITVCTYRVETIDWCYGRGVT